MILKTSLYNHQKAAVEKLLPLKIGALYMEMGTGKTRTALEIIARRVNADRINAVLWLCPCSVKTTIAMEIKRHCDDTADIIEIHGIESLSSSYDLNEKLLELVTKKRAMLVVDESNLVKNGYALRTKSITRLASMCKYRMILNGTPISRTEADLFAQWYILDWRVLGYRTYWSFSANHIEYDEKIKGRIRRCLNVDYLTEKIAPYTYQVLKSECLTLPAKKEYTYTFDLTHEQSKHYDDVLEFYLPPPESDDWGSAAIYRLFTACQQAASGRRLRFRRYNDSIRTKPFFDNPLENPRLKLLGKIIADYPDKILIWCKYTHEILDVDMMLRTIYGDRSVVLLYGKLSVKQRDDSIRKFVDEARFLVGNKNCGGYGLNLQFCNNAIYYNNDFDWAMRAQSEDRVHRIGQESDVVITNICAEKTVDERILDNLSRKTRLVDAFRNEIDKVKDKREYTRKLLKGIKDGKVIS